MASMNNSKEFWGQIRKYRRRKFISNDISAEEWVDHFEKVFNENGAAQSDIEMTFNNIDESYDDILDADISEREVRKAIQHLKCGKAAGPDGILAEMLKTADYAIIPYLTRYCNVLCSSAQFPLKWSKPSWLTGR